MSLLNVGISGLAIKLDPGENYWKMIEVMSGKISMKAARYAITECD